MSNFLVNKSQRRLTTSKPRLWREQWRESRLLSSKKLLHRVHCKAQRACLVPVPMGADRKLRKSASIATMLSYSTTEPSGTWSSNFFKRALQFALNLVDFFENGGKTHLASRANLRLAMSTTHVYITTPLLQRSVVWPFGFPIPFSFTKLPTANTTCSKKSTKVKDNWKCVWRDIFVWNSYVNAKSFQSQ